MAQPDQVIVNEYEPGQGIARHTDCKPCFGPTVAMVSLASDIEMDFTGPVGQTERLKLERCSLLVLSGQAREEWGHEIAKRRSDPQFGIQRRRRVSLTFRSVTPT
jgi:alkylated DNA repair dioxygenase AlkB